MSKYKTPFPAEVQSSKALENRTSKYRLPFKKDQPIEDLQVTLNNLSQHNITLQSDIKLPKLTMSTELKQTIQPRKHKNNLSIHQEVNIPIISDRQQLIQNYIQDKIELTELKTLPQEVKESQRQKAQSQRSQDEGAVKPKISIYSKRKRRFLSSASKYADEQGIDADCTQQSESEVGAKKQKGKHLQTQLPIIGQSKFKPERQDSDDDVKIWESLAKEIETYHESKQKQQSFKHKLKKKNHKNRKSLSRKNYQLEDNEIQMIQGQHNKKSYSIDKYNSRSKSLVDNPAFYQLLKQSQSSPKNKLKLNTQEKQMKESLSLMQKLKQIIAIRNQKLNKAKLKLPLQFYINSYAQIKSINPFFRKLSQMQGCILLNIGKLTMFDANKSIYSQGDTCKDIYIIIYGKVLLNNKYKTLKKFAITGETLGEEELFENEKSYIERLKQHSRPNLHRYQAKALNKTCLLRIKLSKYYKMSCQLNRMGYKQQFNLIDNLFRINYLNKQTNVHYNQRQRIQTESSGHKVSLKHGGPFFY